MTRWWHWLLRAYPAEFRYEYGSELAAAFQERYREERGVARLRFCIEAAADVLSTASKERYHVMIRDVLHSVRRLLAQPGLAGVAILSLALGIGANTAMFSVIYASVLRPLAYPDVDRRIVVYTTALNSPNATNRSGVATADFVDWRAQSTSLEDWHMFSRQVAITARGEGLPERITQQHVTPGLLDSLGVKPVIGRLFRPGEEAERPALIGEAYWRRRFGGQVDALGKVLNGHTIIGVVPASFELLSEPSTVDFWNTIHLAPGTEWMQRKTPWLMATAKRKPGVSVEQAQAEMAGIADRLARGYPETNRNRGVLLMPIYDAARGYLGTLLYPLFGAVGFVLLIGCANVANLLLARATARRREISVRAALGAGRDRLAREFLADGIVLAVPGILLGAGVGYAGIALFRAAVPSGFAGASLVQLNEAVLAFTATAGAIAGILAAVAPAWTGSRVDLAESLKEGGRGSGGRRRQRARSALVAGEIALALILLVGAGLTIGSLRRMEGQDLGFDPSNVTIAELNLSGTRYMTNAPSRDMDMRYVEPGTALFIEHALREARALPGVQSVAMAANVPMGPVSATAVAVRVAGQPAEGNAKRATYNVITAGFFETMRIPLRRGRGLREQDTVGTPWVAIVNETFAREFFPNSDPLGKVIHLSEGPETRPREIVGVVADYTQFTPRMPSQSEVFTSHAQQAREIPGSFQGSRFRGKLILRTAAPGAVKAENIAKIVADFDKDLAVYGVLPMREHLARRSVDLRFYANALGLFSAIALILSAIGIYGLVNYSVTDRIHEIGIRQSLGASRRRVLWLIVSDGLKLAGVGIAIGLAGALAATRLLQTVLFDIKPSDPATFAGVSLFLLAVAVSACVIPALRATAIDPVVALRTE